MFCLDTPTMTFEEMKKAELIVNELIREGRKVSVDVIKTDQEDNLNDVS